MFGVKTMECKSCKETMVYNNHYHCYQCDRCNKTYNAIGNELAPLSTWKSSYDHDDERYYDDGE